MERVLSARLPLCLGLILTLGAARALAQTPARTDGVMACRLAACPGPRAEPASACVPDGGVIGR
jgi:hypothetical protein